MVLQLNLTDLTSNKPLLNLLKKLAYIEVREVKKTSKKPLDEAKIEHDELKSAFLLHSKTFLGSHLEKL
jgi:hypothetical protein